MALFGMARWLGPVPNRNAGGLQRPVNGLVLHIEQGTEGGTNSWFHNPESKVSAHFGNPQAGGLDQWVDTDDIAWAQGPGNTTWISLENEGNPGDSLNDNQMANAALLLAWLNLTESVPMQVADSSADQGLAYHSIDPSWGHPQCPGQPVIDQRADLVAQAQGLVIDPVVTSLDPPQGGAGTEVTIFGSGFTFATSVGFGDTEVPQMSVDSDAQITVTVPDGEGTVNVVVTSMIGSSQPSTDNEFQYS